MSVSWLCRHKFNHSPLLRCCIPAW